MDYEVTETDLTFHGRSVIRINEFFYVDTEIPVGHEDFTISESRQVCSYKGCLYGLPEHSIEGYAFFPPVEITQEEIDRAPVIELTGDEENVTGSCRHAA